MLKLILTHKEDQVLEFCGEQLPVCIFVFDNTCKITYVYREHQLFEKQKRTKNAIQRISSVVNEAFQKRRESFRARDPRRNQNTMPATVAMYAVMALRDWRDDCLPDVATCSMYQMVRSVRTNRHNRLISPNARWYQSQKRLSTVQRSNRSLRNLLLHY